MRSTKSDVAASAARTPKDRATGLVRRLGLPFGIASGVGAVVGGGILRAPGAVLDHAPNGQVALFLWSLAGLHCLLGANLLAELMTALPKSGGVFNVAQRVFGPAGALLIGWTDWLQTVAGIAALAIAGAEFLAMLAPSLKAHIPGLGVALVVGFFGLNWSGVRQSARVEIATSVLKVLLLAGLVSLVFVGPSVPVRSTPATSVLTWGGLVLAYQLITGAFSGWQVPAYFAEEDVAPSRNIPLALLVALVLVSAVYLAINAALLHALPVARLRHLDLPAADALGSLAGRDAARLVAAVALVAVLGCLNSNLMVGSRILHALAREGFVPPGLGITGRSGVPRNALVASTGLTIALTLTGRFELIFMALGTMAVAISAVTDLAYFKLRRNEPALLRPFRAIGHPVLPLVVLILDVGVTLAFVATDLRSAMFMAAGIGLCGPMAWFAGRTRKAAAASQ